MKNMIRQSILKWILPLILLGILFAFLMNSNTLQSKSSTIDIEPQKFRIIENGKERHGNTFYKWHTFCYENKMYLVQGESQPLLINEKCPDQ